jgi:hypothetical protein
MTLGCIDGRVEMLGGLVQVVGTILGLAVTVGISEGAALS